MRTSQAVQFSGLLSVPYFERFIHGSGPSPWGRDFTRKRSCCLHRPKPGTEPSLAEERYTPQQATMLWVEEHKVVIPECIQPSEAQPLGAWLVAHVEDVAIEDELDANRDHESHDQVHAKALSRSALFWCRAAKEF